VSVSFTISSFGWGVFSSGNPQISRSGGRKSADRRRDTFLRDEVDLLGRGKARAGK